jgi:hypothetical protein
LAVRFKRHTYDPTEPLTPWVHAIARYKLFDFLRRTRTSWTPCPSRRPIRLWRTTAVLPFAVSIWAVREAATTNLARAGAFAGPVAGGMSATAYALHCTDDSLPFAAVWYGGTIVLCTLAGAAIGPRLLR